MVRTVFTSFLAVSLCVGLAYAATARRRHTVSTSSPSPKKKPAAKKRTGPSSSSTKKSGTTARRGSGTRSKPSAKGSATKKGSPSRSVRNRGKKGAKAKPVARGQQAPTPERVKEIQQALIDRGYLKGEASGVWGQDSAEALKRFQGDKNLEATGKLSALSLIHLGLGPKRDATAQQRTEQHP